MVCPDDMTIESTVGASSIIVDFQEPTAIDIFGQEVFLIYRNYMPGSSFGVGSTIVVYIFSDISGNTASCNFTVTITQGMKMEIL